MNPLRKYLQQFHLDKKKKKNTGQGFSIGPIISQSSSFFPDLFIKATKAVCAKYQQVFYLFKLHELHTFYFLAFKNTPFL